ncbi:MAG: CHASE2 domain-containing protein [Elusimicrobia bacterium]|nr:CHASE2 domain-containing protein [Elusimicrobiota bacterium]
MRKSWVIDAFIGLCLSAVVALGYLVPPLIPLLEGIELKTYDKRAKLRQNPDPSQEIVLIAIDDDSIAQVGRWPWPRSRIAALLDKLAPAGPKVIGLNMLYSEPERNQGLIEIQGLKERYRELLASKQIVDKKAVFEVFFSSAAERLDSDKKLIASLRQAGNVVLPMSFTSGGLRGGKPEELPAVISSSSLSYQVVPGAIPLPVEEGIKAIHPVAEFAEATMGAGHVNIEPDFDGTVRQETVVKKYLDSYYPSYALQLVLAFTDMKASDALFVPGREIKLGKFSIPLNEQSRMPITFNGPYQTFRYFSFQDVMNDKVAMDVFKDKIVIVGVTATGIDTLYVTPVAHNFPGIEVVANVIDNVLQGRFLTRPPGAFNFEAGLIAFVGLFIMFVLPRLRAFWGFFTSVVLLLFMVGAGTYLFVNGQWLKVAYPGTLLAAGYLVIISKRFFVTEKGKELVEASAIETNKMLGLSFQGQGMLDMAFEKFKLCPLDEGMKDTLYNLALDFERKRQFNKAAAVLDHIKAKDPKYKDIADRIAKLKQASEGAVFGGIGPGKKEGTVMIAGGAAKPTLGRYEIEKELGRGAMGIVYLGKDPKINRMVAIKTMALEEGGEGESLKQVKERFFREAESAGTLNHPNIVRIFDAGEEQDVAYIAMELLDGHDLTRFTSKEGLLPTQQAMEYVAIVADALDYAHAQGIVHRDIKPANLMLLKDGTLRVADFGIARITASSKTATGTVMGTPSYMSPEQVAGKKVDGRADLFSLSVVLFEFLTGEKPFKGGEGIGTLLFQIANDPHPDPLALNPSLPLCVKAIVDKGLAKDPAQRYARGSEMAADLRACIQGKACPVAVASAAPTLKIDIPVPAPKIDIPVPAPRIDIPQPAAAPVDGGATLRIEPTQANKTLPAGPPPAVEPTIRIEPVLDGSGADQTVRIVPDPEQKP